MFLYKNKPSISCDNPQIHDILEKCSNQIIDLLKVEPLTRQELMAKMDANITDRAIQVQLAKLKDIGFIDSEGKSTAVVWFFLKKL